MTKNLLVQGIFQFHFALISFYITIDHKATSFIKFSVFLDVIEFVFKQ